MSRTPSCSATVIRQLPAEPVQPVFPAMIRGS